MTTPRSCNGCIGCCLTVAVRELGLRSFEGCPHVRALPTIPTGCGIYADRPASCALWHCGWQLFAHWPEEMRPDRCGVVFETVPEVVKVAGREIAVIEAYVLPGHDEAFENDHVRRAIGDLCDHGYSVLWRMPGAKGSGVERVRLFCLIGGRLTVGPITDTTPPKNQTFPEYQADRANRLARIEHAEGLARRDQ